MSPLQAWRAKVRRFHSERGHLCTGPHQLQRHLLRGRRVPAARRGQGLRRPRECRAHRAGGARGARPGRPRRGPGRRYGAGLSDRHKLDRRLAGLGRALGWTYTRYADDLTFSSDAKTRVLRRGQHQQVTGAVVNDVLGVSRKERRRLRAMLHQHGDDPAWRDRLEGALGWVAAVNPEQAERLRVRWQR